jgi:hypothetical protein
LTQQVHWLDFNKGILLLEMHGTNIKIYTVYLYLETALHVSGGTSTHHQERKQLYLQHLVFVTTLLLPAAIVEELGEKIPETVSLSLKTAHICPL